MSTLRISSYQREQAERMAAKLEACAEAFYTGDCDGWGFRTFDFCKTIEEALAAECKAQRIYDAISSLTSGCGTWADVQIIRSAVASRNSLDAELSAIRDLI